ncbi:MAG TPA: hypothetical protein VE360_09520, partial [Pyrinomonadaceae bacterium]|nr:hypothetical protein [Pyrinomonadaceae bacterium]
RVHGSSYLAAFRARLGAVSSGLGNVGNHVNLDDARGVSVVAVLSLAAMLLGSLTGMLIVSSLVPSTPDAAPSALMREPTEADATASVHPAASTSSPPEDIPRPAGEDKAAVAHGNPSTGGLGAAPQAQAEPGRAKPVTGSPRSERSALRAVFDNWLAATNQRDLEKQINLYTKKVDTFYGKRNASREVVRDHKSRLFMDARSIEMRASEPEISVELDGRRATMRFRKKWVIKGKRNSRGEATQELGLLKTESGWKITGERNVDGTKVRPESKKAEQAHER